MDNMPNWEKWLKNLESKLHPDTFQQYFGSVKMIGVGQGVLRIEVPMDSDFTVMNQFYSGLSSLAWKEVTDELVRVEFLPGSPSHIATPQPQEPAPAPLSQFKHVEATPKRAPQKRIQRSFSDLPGIYLNDEYTFDTYVVGGNSEFANAAALSVAQNVETNRYNPLLIYGGSGLGKTHLIQAIGHYYLEHFPDKTVHYIDANSFKREYVSSLMKKNDRSNSGKSILEEMSDYYRNKVDLLLMDDIQDLSNQTETQNAFFHIFNSLHQSGKQIVLTSDCPPSEVEMLEDRLISRFEWGLTVDVQMPSIETREAILKDKAIRHKIEVPDDLITYIAESIDKDVRSLEQVIKQLMFRSTHSRSEITMELCQEVLANVNKSSIKKVRLEDVLKLVSDFFEIDKSLILAGSRGTKEVAQARQVAMYLFKEASKSSLKSIGQAFNNRDHATVIHAIRRVQETMDVDPMFTKSVESLRQKLQS